MFENQTLILDLLGHFFYMFIFGGLLLLSKKNRLGWIVRLVGELGWAGIGIYMGMTSIWLWAIPFIYIDIKGYLYWKKNQ